MATKTIGSTGDYTTPQLWEDSLAATLTEAEVGQLQNESHSGDLTISGITTSASFTITLECVSGGSFRDHANKATNALYPTASYGAIMTNAGTYSTAVSVGASYVTIRNIQILKSGTPSQGITSNGSQNYIIYDSCLCQAKPNSTNPVLNTNGNNSVIKNCCAVNAGAAGDGIVTSGGSVAVTNNTVVRPTVNSASNTGIRGAYTGTIAKNNAIFGFTTSTSNMAAGTDYNGSDVTLPTGSNNQASLTYADQFENTGGTLSASDFRIKSTATLKDTATSTGAPSVDIVNQSRTGSYDIGAWEYQAPAGGSKSRAFNGGVFSGTTFGGRAFA